MYGLLDVSYSGMQVQRVRVDVAATNIAGQSTLRDSSGRLNPFRRREAILRPGLGADAARAGGTERSFGVHVAEVSVSREEPPLVRYDPGNDNAYTDGPYKGWVPGTGIVSVYEQVNAMEAARAYEANIMAAETTKQMVAASLRLLG